MKTRTFSYVGIVLSALILLAFSACKAESDELKVIETPAETKTELPLTNPVPVEESTKATNVLNHFDPLKYKLGTGISGIAAKEGKPFLLDKNTTDNRLRPYFSRPNISSSMVIPLKAENRLVGVMNLGALETSAVRFNKDNINLMNKLADLVTVAVPI